MRASSSCSSSGDWEARKQWGGVISNDAQIFFCLRHGHSAISVSFCAKSPTTGAKRDPGTKYKKSSSSSNSIAGVGVVNICLW